MCKNSISGRIVKNAIGRDTSSKNNMKQTLGLGIGSMAGMSAMGQIPQPAGAGNTVGTVGASMNLLNTGMLAKNGMGIVGMMGVKKYGKHRKH